MSDPFVGEIMLFAGTFAPRNWAFCDGRTVSISQHTELFAILGTTYGGDGRTTVGLPKLDSFRVPIHPGTTPSLNQYVRGQVGGTETVTLATNELAGHDHTLIATSTAADQTQPIGRILGASIIAPYEASDINNLVSLDSNSLTTVGNGEAHNNLQPYVTLHYIIALFGVFTQPS